MGPRVAMVCARYPPHLGGVETHVREVATRIAARGTDVTVLTTEPAGRTPFIGEGSAPLVRRFPAWPGRSDLYLSPALAREIHHGGYDVVHVQGVHTLLAPMALSVAQRSGVPTVLTFHTGGHSSRVRNLLRGAQWHALQPLLRRTAALIAVCRYEVETFGRRLRVEPERIHLIPNGSDPLPIGPATGDVSGSPLISSVGRLERYKGHQRLIRAMPPLLERAPGAHLVVVGRGAFERKLRRLVARLRVADAVTFTAFDPSARAALGRLLLSSDVVALMSEYEAHPVAVMEALALGRKVLVADTSGLSELASEGLATAIPLHASPQMLAATLARVAGFPDPVVPALSTWDDCAEQVLRLYREILAGSAS